MVGAESKAELGRKNTRAAGPSTQPTARPRRPGLRAGAFVILLLLSALAVALPSAAVHNDGLFELGNGTTTPGGADIVGDGAAGTGPDWANYSGGGDGLFNATGAVVFPGAIAEFILDDLSESGSVDRTVFSQSNKNNDATSTWNWDTGNNPPKDDLANVYIYAALDGAGDLVMYVGLERLAPEGDSHVDIEFNQAGISLDEAIPCNDPGPDTTPCSFVGEKSTGDLLIVMDFEQGGVLGFVEVRQWDGDSYELVTGGSIGGEGCNSGDTVCAFNNGADIDGGPWVNYDRHGDEIMTLPANSFTEIGVNVTGLTGSTPCFSSVIAKTRSSQSFNSELKDFAGPVGFPLCDFTVTKTGPDLSKAGDTVTYTYTIENTGGATIYLESVVDDVVGTLISPGVVEGPAVTSNTCGASLDSGDICTITADYVVQEGDPDPLVNTVTVTYDTLPSLEGTDIVREDDHTIELFQPGVDVTKTADTDLSKIGDMVTYTIEICNSGSDDSPAIFAASVIDSILGDLTGDFVQSLAPGECESHSYPYTVMEGDNDPLINTVDVLYHPEGFPNDLTDSDSVSVNLFQPSVSVEKTADTDLSKIGDTITYTITICNTGSADSPDLVLDSVMDSLLGDLTASFAASLGLGCESHDFPYVVQEGDDDPLVNTVEVHYHPDGFPNDISAEASLSIELFQPSVDVTKTADTELSKIGDTITYTIEICNSGSSDSPAIFAESVHDSILGHLTAFFVLSLAPGDCESHDFDYTVQEGDPDPLVNTVTVLYHPEGFPNDLTDSDSVSVNLFQPGVSVDKTADTELSKIGDTITYTIEICNSGSADSPSIFAASVLDSLLGDLTADFTASLAPGECESHSYPYVVQEGDPDPLINTVDVLYHPEGFPNDLTDSDSVSVNLFQPGVSVDKTANTDLSKIGDTITYTIEICNSGSADSPNILAASVLDSLLGDLTADFTLSLAPGDCESHDFDYTVLFGDPDPLINTVDVLYHPEGFPNDLTDSDSVSVNLFQPAVDVEKTGPALSKAGDTVTYTIEVCNEGSADSPALVLDSVVDTLLGDITAMFSPSLVSGACDVVNVDYTVHGYDPDPLVNTVVVHYHPDGFPNDITDEDSWTTNLFQPSVDVEKSADVEVSKAGDTITYTIEICNSGSSDSPAIFAESVHDSILGHLTAFFVLSLAPGDCESHDFDYTVQEGDPDPLVNTVTVLYHPEGFPNDLTDSDSATVDLVHPSFTLSKTCPAAVGVGEDIPYQIIVTNTGDVTLVFLSVVDTLFGDITAMFPGSLAAGGVATVDLTHTATLDDPNPLENTVSVTMGLDPSTGLPNQLSASDSCSTQIVSGSLQWHKVDGQGQPLGGAQFEVCRTHTLDTIADPDTMVDTADDCFLVDDDTDGVVGPGLDQDPAPGEFLLVDLILGRYTVRETMAPPGYDIGDPSAVTAPDMSLADPDVEITTAFVNTQQNEGCTPGFWKTHPELWDGVGTDDVTTTIQTFDLFNAVFGVTSAQSGLADSITLLQALSVKGSDLMALNRHAAAALVNADSGIAYEFSLAEVISIYRDAVGADAGPETIASALLKFQTANERGCPLGTVSSLSVGAGALGLSLTPMSALVWSLLGIAWAVVLLPRSLGRRAHGRSEAGRLARRGESRRERSR